MKGFFTWCYVITDVYLAQLDAAHIVACNLQSSLCLLDDALADACTF